MAHLKTDPLFLGLTRPAMVFGVSFLFFGLNALVSVMYFIMTSDFKVVIVAVAIHFVGVLITKKEPLAVEILMTKIQKCSAVPNKSFYGGLNSYGTF